MIVGYQAVTAVQIALLVSFNHPDVAFIIRQRLLNLLQVRRIKARSDIDILHCEFVEFLKFARQCAKNLVGSLQVVYDVNVGEVVIDFRNLID